jgi:hypothetical protein
MRHLEQFGEHSSLEKCLSEVTTDGEYASYDMRYSGLPDFRVALRFSELGLAMHELRRTAARMVRLRAAWPDKGRSAIMEVAESAVMPKKIDVILDPRTGDRTIVVQSDCSAPFGIKLTPFEAEILLQRLELLKKLGSH